MGSDSVKPFLTHENKWAVVLAMTSNEGARDFQFLEANNVPILRPWLRNVNNGVVRKI